MVSCLYKQYLLNNVPTGICLLSRQFFVPQHVYCFEAVLCANVLVTHGQGARDEGEKSGAPRQIIRGRLSEF